MNDIARIALIGPESSGKSFLCSELAKHFQTEWVPEYARDYILSLGRPYTKDDVMHCIHKQMEVEDQALPIANKFLFSDTELIVARVWLLDVFGECPEWIDKKITERKYDLYLLTKADIPFIDDPVRENPHRREFFFDWYRKELDERMFPYKIVSGNLSERFGNAITSIQSVGFTK